MKNVSNEKPLPHIPYINIFKYNDNMNIYFKLNKNYPDSVTDRSDSFKCKSFIRLKPLSCSPIT
jgi:hypothetical protein